VCCLKGAAEKVSKDLLVVEDQGLVVVCLGVAKQSWAWVQVVF
jgi:hypothetical protein